MTTTKKVLAPLTARDLMTREVVTIPQEMALWDAAGLLVKNQISGAPVVDGQGKCVGVLSVADFVRAVTKDAESRVGHSPSPAACSFQRTGKTQGGKQVVVCTLPPGVCPIQKKEKDGHGKEMMVCTEPHGILADWQTVEAAEGDAKEVWRYMTTDPVMVSPGTPVRTLARCMIDARIHRVVVVDDQQRPIGVVSSTDILGVVALAVDERREPISER